jgi:hypothetical protein
VGRHAHAGIAQGDGLRLASERDMESYSYVNIFETKGLEYLLLGCFLVMLVFLIRYLAGSSNKQR